MTLREIISELRLTIRAQQLYDDDELDDRLLKHWVHNQRALWIRNEINKNHSVDDQIIQKACLQMEVADRSDCPVQTTQFDVLRSIYEIPKTIELHHNDGIVRVGPIDVLAQDYSYVPLSRAKMAGNGRFNTKVVFAFRYHNRMYIHSQKTSNYARYIRYIMIYGLFEDPTALSRFTHIDDTPCYSDNNDYPLNSWMWNYIKSQILRAEFDLLIQAPVDNVNDSSDNVTPQNATARK
jgi:hypothetical protein